MKNIKLIAALLLISIIGCKKIKPLSTPIDYAAAYIINGENNTISVINMVTNEVTGTATFEKGTWPHHIYASSDKSKVVVSLTGTDLSGGHNAGGHSAKAKTYLMTLDAKTLKLLTCIKTDNSAHNALFVSNDAELWLPQIKSEGVIKVLNPATLKEVSSIAVGDTPLEVTINSTKNYVFVANSVSNTVSVIDVATKTVVKTIAVGASPVGAWAGSNNKMYVDCEVSKQVFEIDAAALLITDTITLKYTPAYVAFNGKTNQLWVSDAEFGKVRIYNNVNSTWIETTTVLTGDNAHAIAFNNAQTIAYVTNQGAASVSLIDAVALTKIKDITVGKKPNGITIIE